MSARVGMVLLGATDELWPKLIVPYMGGTAATWHVANSGIWVLFRVAKPRRATGIRLGIGVASGNIIVGMYSSDGTTLTKLVISASTAAAGSNTKQDIPFTTPVDLTPNTDYSAFVNCDTSSTLTVLRVLAGYSAFGPNFGMFGTIANTFTPPDTALISNFTNTASGYCPTVQVY